MVVRSRRTRTGMQPTARCPRTRCGPRLPPIRRRPPSAPALNAASTQPRPNVMCGSANAISRPCATLYAARRKSAALSASQGTTRTQGNRFASKRAVLPASRRPTIPRLARRPAPRSMPGTPTMVAAPSRAPMRTDKTGIAVKGVFACHPVTAVSLGCGYKGMVASLPTQSRARMVAVSTQVWPCYAVERDR